MFRLSAVLLLLLFTTALYGQLDLAEVEKFTTAIQRTEGEQHFEYLYQNFEFEREILGIDYERQSKVWLPAYTHLPLGTLRYKDSLIADEHWAYHYDVQQSSTVKSLTWKYIFPYEDGKLQLIRISANDNMPADEIRSFIMFIIPFLKSDAFHPEEMIIESDKTFQLAGKTINQQFLCNWNDPATYQCAQNGGEINWHITNSRAEAEESLESQREVTIADNPYIDFEIDSLYLTSRLFNGEEITCTVIDVTLTALVGSSQSAKLSIYYFVLEGNNKFYAVVASYFIDENEEGFTPYLLQEIFD